MSDQKREAPTPRQRGDIGWIRKQRALAAARKRAAKQRREEGK